MRNRILATLAVSALLAAVACGSNKPAPTSATSSATPTATAATSATTATAKSGGTGGAVAGALLGTKFCSDWNDVSAKTPSNGAGAAAPTGLPSAAEMKASIEATNASMKVLVDQAPAEIKPDFQVYAKFWSDYATLMAKANYNYLAAAQDPAFLTLMQGSSASLQTASQNIQAYMQKNCTR